MVTAARKFHFLTNNLPLRKKLLLLLYLVSLVPLLCTTVFLYRCSTNELERELGIYTIEITRQVDNRLQSFIQEIDRIGNQIRLNSDVQQFLLNKRYYDNTEGINAVLDIRRMFSSIGNLRENLAGIFLINDYGDMVYDAVSAVAKTDNREEYERWIHQIQPDRALKLLPVHPQTLVKDQPVVSFVARIMEFFGSKEKGTLMIDFSPRVIDQMSDNIKLGETGYVFLLTEEGKPVNLDSRYPEGLVGQQVFKEMLKGDNGHFTLIYNGQKTLVGFSTSKQTGWKIVGVVPFQEVASGIYGIRLKLFFIATICIFFIFIISTYFAGVLITPLKNLESKMTQVEKGDLSVRVPPERADEIGRLGKRFNHMLDELQRLKEEVYLAQIREYSLKLLCKESEFAALQAQINPHFLYNTLNTMTCMAEVYNMEEMALMSKALAHMFKYSIHGSHVTGLADELTHVEAYLQIINIRYPGRFRYRLEIDGEIGSVYVLKLILQPLVENAVIHGFKDRDGHGEIRVIIEARGNHLYLCISDDGVGIPEEKLSKIRAELTGAVELKETQRQHLGLLNVWNRLLLYYDNRARMELDSIPGRGTSVSLYLPQDQSKRGESDALQNVSGG